MNQPFVRVEATIDDAMSSTWSRCVWRDRDERRVLRRRRASRSIRARTRFYADVPVETGHEHASRIDVERLGERHRSRGAHASTSTSSPIRSRKARPAAFFDHRCHARQSGSGADAPIDDRLPAGRRRRRHVDDTGARRTSPLQIHVDNVVPNASLSTVVHSTDGVPLAVERTMIWDARGYGGHGGTAVAPATRWLFAEGSQGFFNTYVLLANDNATRDRRHGAVPARRRRRGHARQSRVPAKSRHTMYAGDIPALVESIVRHRHHVVAADHRGARDVSAGRAAVRGRPRIGRRERAEHAAGSSRKARPARSSSASCC